jgi:lipopolysaccharide export system permease protein
LKILTKYILKEHLSPLLFSLSALTSLLLLNYIAKQFGQLVGKNLPAGVIAEFLLLSVPFTVAMTLPMAVLVSTLHAFSRMASENEITAFKASGIAMQKLMVPVIISAAILTVSMVWFNDQVLPAANHRLTTLTNDIARTKPTFALKEQIINPISPGLFLRTARLFGTNQMRDVAIYDLTDPQTRLTIHADSGLLELSENRHDLLLTLYHGSWTVLKPDDPTGLRRVFFQTDYVKVRNISNSLERDTIGGGEKSDREMTVCELQRRVARMVRARDSTYLIIKALDSNVAKTVRRSGVSTGIGSLYCGRPKLSKISLVKAAHAEVVQPQQPQQQQPPPQPQTPQPQTPQPQPPPASASQTRIAPDMPAPAADPEALRAAKAGQLKLQIDMSQSTIDGDQVEIEKKFSIAARA